MPRVKNDKVKNVPNHLLIDVVDINGKAIERLELPSAFFGARVNPQLMTQAVYVFLQNQRSGTAKAKNRGEVKGTTKKLYRQKHTGRARHGAETAPIFVGGGVAHGPRPKDWAISLPKKMKHQALCSALSNKYQDQSIRVVAGLETIAPKTKNMAKILDKINLSNSQAGKLLLVLPGKIDNVEKAARNIPYVNMGKTANLNTYQVLAANTLLFTRDAVQSLAGRVKSDSQEG
ncbi:50S ribosomal protein L4 [Candidatus Daviesbacteria bacterium]|nr:50S ribosomal protein L4 [Candidatus Daviesbacteria bacterium]